MVGVTQAEATAIFGNAGDPNVLFLGSEPSGAVPLRGGTQVPTMAEGAPHSRGLCPTPSLTRLPPAHPIPPLGPLTFPRSPRARISLGDTALRTSRLEKLTADHPHSHFALGSSVTCFTPLPTES